MLSIFLLKALNLPQNLRLFERIIFLNVLIKCLESSKDLLNFCYIGFGSILILSSSRKAPSKLLRGPDGRQTAFLVFKI